MVVLLATEPDDAPLTLLTAAVLRWDVLDTIVTRPDRP